MAMVGSSLQEVTQQSPMAAAMSSIGLNNILNPEVGALAVNTGHADRVTSGIPPGMVVDEESWDHTDCQAMFSQTEDEAGTFEYEVNRNGIFSNRANFAVPSI